MWDINKTLCFGHGTRYILCGKWYFMKMFDEVLKERDAN